MPTFRDLLLTKEGQLEDDEIHTLRGWLDVLREDVAAFGATPEDEARMRAIADRIAGASEVERSPGIR